MAADVATATKKIACYVFLIENRDNPLLQGVTASEFCRLVDALEHYLLYRDMVWRNAPLAERAERLALAATHVDSNAESPCAFAQKLANGISREQRTLCRADMCRSPRSRER